jgi:MFS family permease
VPVSRRQVADAGAPRALDPAGLRRVLAVLCVTETTSWGIVFYSYPVLAAAISADTGWSRPGTAAAFSLALVLSGLVGIPVGRRLDRVGPRGVMTLGSVLAVVAVLLIAWAPSLVWFTVAWALAGIAMAGILYAPAFAALTRWFGARRVAALTTLTLMAGLASTIFAPVTALLERHLGWRGCYLVLAVVLAEVTVPGHLLGLRGRWPNPSQRAAGDADDGAPGPAQAASVGDPARGLAGGAAAGVGEVRRSRPFRVLMGLALLASLAESAVVVRQVTLLIARGLSPTVAAWALGLGGFGQVLGRLGYRRLAEATSVRARTLLVLAAAVVATGLLAVLPGPAWLLVAVAVLAGTARGIWTLLQATAVTDRWGPAHYGRLNGLLTAPIMLATAAAPWLGAVTAEALGGYPALFLALTVLLLAAAVASWWTVPDDQA